MINLATLDSPRVLVLHCKTRQTKGPMDKYSKALLCFAITLPVCLLRAQTASIVLSSVSTRPEMRLVGFRGSLCFFGQLEPSKSTLSCSDPDGSHPKAIFTVPGVNGTAEGLVVLNNLMYFNVLQPGYHPSGQPQFNTDLYVSDGTPTGTRLLSGFPTDADSFRPWDFTVVGQKLYYFYDDGSRQPQLWVSDGSSNGSHLLKRFRNPTTGKNPGLTYYNGKVFFEASDTGVLYKLWTIDTASETVNPLFEFKNDPPYITNFTPVNGKLYFRAQDSNTPNPNHRTRLWVTDGTNKGTHTVTTSSVEADYALGPMSTSASGDRLYFATDRKLWFTDGAGPVLIATLPGDTALLLPSSDGLMYFFSTDPADDAPTGTHHTKLWVTDGSPQGTRAIITVDAFSALSLSNFVVLIKSQKLDEFKTMAYSNGALTALPACNGAQNLTSYVKVYDSLYFPTVGTDHQWHVCRVH